MSIVSDKSSAPLTHNSVGDPTINHLLKSFIANSKKLCTMVQDGS
jgi:hypothetical protein